MDGYMWFGMLGELIRYDGLRILKVPIPGKNATLLRPNSIVSLGRDSLLIGGDFGLKVFDTSTLTFGDSIPSNGNSVYTLKEIGDNKALAGWAKGLMIIDSSLSIDTITVPHSVNNLSAAVYDIDISPDSTIWITTNYGIFKSPQPESDNKLRLKHVTGDATNFFSRIAVSDNRIYAYTSGAGRMPRGVYDYDQATGQWHFLNRCNGMSVSSLIVKENRLYVSTDGDGITVFDTNDNSILARLNTTSADYKLPSNGVYSLYINVRDDLYIGYYQMGVEVLSLKPESVFSNYSDGNTFNTAGLFVRTISRSYPYHITATRDKVMITDESLGMTRTLEISVFDNCQPIDIIPVDNGFAIGVFGGGVFHIDKKTGAVRRYEGSEGLRVCDITVDEQDRLWVGATEGVYRFVDGKLDKCFTPDNSCLVKGILRIYFDKTGRGWISTQSGLAVYDPLTDKVRNDLFPDGFIGNEFVRCITEDANGNLLFAYDRNKLFKSDARLKNFSQIHHRLSLGTADINIMQQLPDGGWLIGTSAGLFGTDGNFNCFTSYGPRDGITSNMFNPSHVIDTVAGRLYLSNSEGLLVADIERLTNRDLRDKLTIAEIRFNGERFNGLKPRVINGRFLLEVPHHTGTVDIFFTDFVSSQNRPDHIEYCIDNDTVWQTLSIMRPISVHYNGSLDRSVKVRPAGSPELEINIDLHEPGSHSWLWRTLLTVIIAVGTGACVYVYLYRRKSTENESAIAVDNAEVKTVSAERQDKKSKYRNLNISEQELARLSKRLDLLLYDTKIYRQPDLKIGQLADKLGVSTAVLSYYFSQHLNSNYYSFLNSYRVKEFKEMVEKGTYRKYTLSAMSQMCGFSSRTSFFRYFKEAEGISPLDYIKRAEKDGSGGTK